VARRDDEGFVAGNTPKTEDFRAIRVNSFSEQFSMLFAPDIIKDNACQPDLRIKSGKTFHQRGSAGSHTTGINDQNYRCSGQSRNLGAASFPAGRPQAVKKAHGSFDDGDFPAGHTGHTILKGLTNKLFAAHPAVEVNRGSPGHCPVIARIYKIRSALERHDCYFPSRQCRHDRKADGRFAAAALWSGYQKTIHTVHLNDLLVPPY